MQNLIRTTWALGAMLALALPAAAVLPDDIREGARVALEGTSLDATTLMATEIEIVNAPMSRDEVKGVIRDLDPQRRTLNIGGVDVVLQENADVLDMAKAPTEWSQFQVGVRAKAEGDFRDGSLHAVRIRLKKVKPGTENEVDLSGVIASVDRTSDSFKLFGIEVVVGPQTQVQVE